MDEDRWITAWSLAMGTLLVATGTTIAGHYAFKQQHIPVYLALVIFTTGYKVSWYGARRYHSFESIVTAVKKIKDTGPKHVAKELENYILLATGLASISYGFTSFTQNIVNFSFESVIIAGLAVFGGYMVAHEGVNEVLI